MVIISSTLDLDLSFKSILPAVNTTASLEEIVCGVKPFPPVDVGLAAPVREGRWKILGKQPVEDHIVIITRRQ
jgi:hypothetical protein